MEKRWYEYLGSLFGGWLQGCAALVIAGIFGWWEGMPAAQQNLLRAALILWVADTGLGILRACACPAQKLSSRKMGAALVKIIVYALAYLVGVALDMVFGVQAGVQFVVIGMVIVREGTSCAENLAVLGCPLPTWVTAQLEAMEEKLECGVNGDGNGVGTGMSLTRNSEGGAVEGEDRPGRRI